jgi:hypothetical protein
MRHGRTLLSLAVAVAVAVPAGGCLVPDPEPLASAEIDESSLLSMLPIYDGSPAFTRLNEEPYLTALPSGAALNVWVSSNAFAAYGGIAPETVGSGIEAPEGTMIVREVLDGAGAIETLTLMYKGPQGYNPEVGDYWFGVTDPDGKPIKMGKLEECYGCHQERAADGYLFGVPRGVR